MTFIIFINHFIDNVLPKKYVSLSYLYFTICLTKCLYFYINYNPYPGVTKKNKRGKGIDKDIN